MKREFYLELARGGLRMPIGTDLVLHETERPEAVLVDGNRLGKVVEQAARRYRTPLALSHMDLEVEKEALLTVLAVPAEQIPAFRFEERLPERTVAAVPGLLRERPTPRLRAQAEALQYLSTETDLVPVGMCIGPFSLMTKLLADPITAVCLAGAGASAADEPEVARMEQALALAFSTVEASIEAKIQAGAAAICIAEPAANKVFLSPRQIRQGSDIFERYVMHLHRRLRRLLGAAGVDLVFHCCGELVPEMVRGFASLDPAILSLGSSRKLWEDSALVADQTVLFGNLPSKRFYSDELSVEAVVLAARELLQNMKVTGHPFILGTECDVLSVPGREDVIRSKVDAMMAA